MADFSHILVVFIPLVGATVEEVFVARKVYEFTNDFVMIDADVDSDLFALDIYPSYPAFASAGDFKFELGI